MRKLVVAVVVVVNLILLSSCKTSQFASNADKHYLRSRNGNSLVVPSPLTSSNISHFYDLPPSGETSAVSIVPPN